MGDHPLVGLATTLLDPAFLNHHTATAGAVNARGGRVMSGVVSGVLAAVVTLSAEGPTDLRGGHHERTRKYRCWCRIFKPGKGW